MSNDRIGVDVARIGGIDSDEWFAVTTTPTLVTFNSYAPLPWRCEIHGRTAQPSCEHTLAAQARARKHFTRNTNRKEQTS